MSRSYKKKPIAGHGGLSEKRDKQAYSRGFRNTVRCMIRRGLYDLLPKRPNYRHGGNWNFQKDGKSWIKKKVREEFPQLLRK